MSTFIPNDRQRYCEKRTYTEIDVQNNACSNINLMSPAPGATLQHLMAAFPMAMQLHWMPIDRDHLNNRRS